MSLLEASGAYDVTAGLAITGRYQNLDYGVDGTFRLLSIGAADDVSDAITVNGKFGWNQNYYSPDEVYNGTNISVGVNINFGNSDTGKVFTYDPYF